MFSLRILSIFVNETYFHVLVATYNLYFLIVHYHFLFWLFTSFPLYEPNLTFENIPAASFKATHAITFLIWLGSVI